MNRKIYMNINHAQIVLISLEAYIENEIYYTVFHRRLDYKNS